MAVLREIVCARVGLLFEQFVDASHFVDCLVKVEVLVVADNVGKADAAAMYKEVL